MYIVLFLVIPIAQGKRVDVVTPDKTIPVHILVFTMCGKPIAYIYQHKGRTKIVAPNRISVEAFKQIKKYFSKNPKINGKYRVPSEPLPCPVQNPSIPL